MSLIIRRFLKKTLCLTLCLTQFLVPNLLLASQHETLLTDYTQDVSALFPDRPRSGTPVAKAILLKGGEVHTGEEGLRLHTQDLIQATPIVDVGRSRYSIKKKGYREKGAIPQYTIIQPKFLSKGPIDLESDHLALQAAFVATYGKDSNISVIGRRQLDLPDKKVWQDIVPILKKGKRGVVYRISGQHEIGEVNVFLAPNGKVILESLAVSVSGVMPYIEKLNADPASGIKKLNLPQQVLDERYHTRVVSKGIQARLKDLATLG